MAGPPTFQSVDCPCLKLVECNLSRGWEDVEVESVLIVLLLELRLGELPFLVVKICAAFSVNSGMVVADHGVVVLLMLLCYATPAKWVTRDLKVAGAVASTRQSR